MYLGVLCLPLFGYALLCIISGFAIILKRKRKLCFAFIVLQMSCYYKCSVTLPHCAMGWSVVIGQNFLLVDLREFFIRFRVGWTKKINKKALKMTSELVIFRVFFLIFSFFLYLQKQ